MASTATYIAEWFRQHLSSAVTFQKQFVDDVAETVKEQKAQFDRHTREANERAIQLHLDDLEEKYLCCVCGRGGEAREDDAFVYDTYSMVSLPPRTALEAAVREELADAEVTDERIKQHQRELVLRQRRGNRDSSARPATPKSRRDEDDLDEVSSNDSSSKVSGAFHSETAHARRKQRKAKAKTRPSRKQHSVPAPLTAQTHQREEDEEKASDVDDGNVRGATASPENPPSPSARSGPLQSVPGENKPGELAVMDPDMVGPLEVRNTLYKIRHAVLHKEARTRRKAVAVHKDKGLMKIEESEIDMFSHFFQRPVHGYLCSACYTCARRRLDSLTQQIRGILFKAQNPILRRVPAKEIEALTSGNQVPTALIHSILAVQQHWARMSEEERMRSRGAGHVAGVAPTSVVAVENCGRVNASSGAGDETVMMGTLPEQCILVIRGEAKCGACQRRAACFFEQKSVVFLCQFCTARDRFYRENAVCINDEAMPVNLVHMLHDFASYYEAIHQQKELRGAPQSAIDQAQTDLFPLAEVLRDNDGLFACQASAVATTTASGRRAPIDVEASRGSEEASPQGINAQATEVPVTAPSTFAAPARFASVSKIPLHEQRERVGRTMVSLFDGVSVHSPCVDLFADQPSRNGEAPEQSRRATSPRSEAPQRANGYGVPSTISNGGVADLFSCSAPAPSPPTSSTAPAPMWGIDAPTPVPFSVSSSAALPQPSFGRGEAAPPAASSEEPNWESLF